MMIAGFCRFWRMTPRDVDHLTNAEFAVLLEYAVREQRDAARAARRRGR